jgi:uncharacterized membrane protein YidH (DUF202 family)
MELQTALLFIVAAVLITIGVTRVAQTRRRNRNRAQRERNRMGFVLIAVGALVGFIGLLGLTTLR